MVREVAVAAKRLGNRGGCKACLESCPSSPDQARRAEGPTDTAGVPPARRYLHFMGTHTQESRICLVARRFSALDAFSGKSVGWEVHTEKSANHISTPIHKTQPVKARAACCRPLPLR